MTSLSTGTRFVQPNIVATHFHLQPGEKVADFGAGSGYFLQALSVAVGSNGRVYACEIQKELVVKLGLVATEKHLSNIEPVWCDLETPGGTKLADGALDAGILVNTLYQIEDKKNTLIECARTIKPGGRFFLIDWTDSFAGLGPQALDIVDAQQAQTLTEAVGFQFERSFDAGEHHYGLAFKKI